MGPVTGIDRYYLYVLDATTGQALINNSNVSGASFTSSAILTPGHSFTWYVASVSGAALSWSDPTGFSLDALAAPMPAGPNGAVPAGTGYDTPTFSWSNVPGAAHYYLYVLDDNTGQTAVSNANVSGVSFPANTPLPPGHSFTWYIGAESTNGVAVSWSGAKFLARRPAAADAEWAQRNHFRERPRNL